MAMSVQIKENCSVYPGEYKPLVIDFGEVKEKFYTLREGTSQPVANIIECADHYKIEVVVPGHSKDDFIVTTDNGHLNVFAIRQKSKNKEQPFYHSHEFNYDFFEHSIQLPGNIDTDFVRAEYKAGILSICFQKTDKPVLNTYHQIIVY
jgi:HSP20 family protein